MKKPIQILRGVRAYFTLLRDPNRLGDVFEIADGLADSGKVQVEVDRFRKTKQGRDAFEQQPRLNIDLAALSRLPPGTLGREFADHMRRNNLDPTAIPTLPSGDDQAYLRAHLYETHDVWHVATGFGTDVPGEVGVQAFYLAQFPAALSLVLLSGVMLNTLFFQMESREPRMDSLARGWLLGRRAHQFFGVRWADWWEVPLVEVRRRLGIDLATLDRDLEPIHVPIAIAA